MKFKVRVLMLMLVMCWASQSLAQTVRADGNKDSPRLNYVGWGFNPTQGMVASSAFTWVTSDQPYLAVYLAHDFPRKKNGKILRKKIFSPTIAVAKSSR